MSEKLEQLKEEAVDLGISFHANIGETALQEKINKHKADEEAKVIKAENAKKPKSKAQLKREASALVRVVVTCMDPMKKEWEGEIFTVGNSEVGTFKKFVPFGTENGWHIPRILFNVLKEKKLQVFVDVKNSRGEVGKRSRLIPAYAVTELPPLSPEELEELAADQRARGATDSE